MTETEARARSGAKEKNMNEIELEMTPEMAAELTNGREEGEEDAE